MEFEQQDQRVVETIRLPLWGGVVPADGATPWLMVDGLGHPVEAVTIFLCDLTARGRSAGTARSYAMALLRWWRFLNAVDVSWERAAPAEVRDLVLWLTYAAKPIAARRTASRPTAGRINPVTRKSHLGDGYGPATIRHNNAVLRAFYDFWLERGGGPLINPVPVERSRGGRANRHHNPMTPFRVEGRLRYNPRAPAKS
ncbi:site-specific integrase [Micromonospora aurantiaca (nom. illeg.)]|uniref:site-specific integrase n=1 Tax=Micromonospora aurantiaca (nom. illeg.) TaxID=47850 RepID=UPI003407B548